MEVENIENIFKRLELLMYGHNYDVGFEFQVFNNCYNSVDFDNEVKAKCSEFHPESNFIILNDINDFWNEINYGLTYRGDANAGLNP